MTQFDPSLPEEQAVDENTHINRVHRVVTIFFGAALAVFAFYLFLAWQMGAWQMYALSAVIAAFAAANFLAMRTVRAGEAQKGSWMVIIGMLVIFPTAVLLIDSISLIFGVTLITLCLTVAAQTLLPVQRRIATIVSIIVGVLTATLDLLPLDYRLFVPEIQAFVPSISALLIITLVLLALWNSRTNLVDYWRSSIRNRLTLIVVGAAIVPVLLISIFLGGITYLRVREALAQTTFDRLDAIEEIKTNQLAGYFAERKSDMVALSDSMGSLLNESLRKMEALNTLKRDQIYQLFENWDADVRDVASDPSVVAGMRDLAIGFKSQGAAQVRSLYSGKPELENAGDETAYSLAHFEQHGFFAGYTDIHGYEDAYLIDLDGNVVYSVHKTDAFGTNLITGAYKDSSLAKLYQNLVSAQAGRSYIADAALLGEKYTMFIGAPIYDGSTQVGMLAYQLPLDTIRSIMAERTGQGLTGESFLLALEDDGRISYRSDRNSLGNEMFVIGYDITDIASPTMRKGLAGESGGGLIAASTGETRINAYRPLDIEGINWVVFTSVNATEALSPVHLEDEKDYLSAYQENYGYYDIFLIHPNGTVFYTAAQEADFGTNILTGPFSDSNLAVLVDGILESKAYEFADFAYYEPSGNAPAAFFGAPVLDADGNLRLIVATQVSVADINQIMNEAHGLGETGESYIIGPDFLGRMDSRFIESFGVETTVLNPDFSVDTEAVRSALAGEAGQGTIIDFRGLPVMSAWKPFLIHEPDAEHPEGQIWAVMTEIDESEALGPVNQLASGLGLIIGLAALVIGALAVFMGTRFALGFVNPILTLTETATQVAAGDLSQRSDVKSADEIGQLSDTLNTMTAQLQETLGGLEERVAARTKDLATVAEISTVTATIRDPQEMLSNMVHLTQRGFNRYHAHVFTYHKDTDSLEIVACGWKEGSEHEGTHGTEAIPLSAEQSLVARAARTRRPVIVNDVQNEPGWLPNPQLPDTRAEMAVPMIVGDELLGVLDVQEDSVDGFTEEDANIKMTLASQVATALQNAQAYTRAQKQAELESMVNLIGQRIQRATTIEDTLQTAIRELGTAIGATRVKASLRSASAIVETTPIEHAEPALAVEAERNNGSSAPDESLDS